MKGESSVIRVHLLLFDREVLMWFRMIECWESVSYIDGIEGTV